MITADSWQPLHFASQQTRVLCHSQPAVSCIVSFHAAARRARLRKEKTLTFSCVTRWTSCYVQVAEFNSMELTTGQLVIRWVTLAVGQGLTTRKLTGSTQRPLSSSSKGSSKLSTLWMARSSSRPACFQCYARRFPYPSSRGQRTFVFFPSSSTPPMPCSMTSTAAWKAL